MDNIEQPVNGQVDNEVQSTQGPLERFMDDVYLSAIKLQPYTPVLAVIVVGAGIAIGGGHQASHVAAAPPSPNVICVDACYGGGGRGGW